MTTTENCLTQRGFEGQRFADNLTLDFHGPDSEISCIVASLAAALHLRDRDTWALNICNSPGKSMHNYVS